MFETFEWTDPDGSRTLRFNVTAMRQFAEHRGRGSERIVFPIEVEHVRIALEEREVDVERARALPEEIKIEPLIGCIMEDGTVLTVDGHHRLVRLFLDRHPMASMWLFDLEMWPLFLL